MADHDDGAAKLAAKRINKSKNVTPSSGVKTCHGLVEHKVFGLHGNNACECSTAFLTAGKLKWRFFAYFIGIEPNEVQGFPAPSRNLFLTEAEIARAEGYVGEHGAVKELVIGVLEYHSDQGSALNALLFIVHVIAVHDDSAARWVHKPVELLNQGRFAASGMTYNADKLTVINGEADIPERIKGARGILHVCITQFFNNNGHNVSANSSAVRASEEGNTPS